MREFLLKFTGATRLWLLLMIFTLPATTVVGQETTTFVADSLGYSSKGYANPTITSDKEDYSPGDVAIISGTGWTLDSVVDIHIEEEPTHLHHHGFHNTTVNDDGSWEIRYDITEDHVGVKFTVIVDGLTSKYQGTHNFTDAGIANVQVNKSNYCAGESITISFRAAANSGPVSGGFGNSNEFIAELSDEDGLFSSPSFIGSLQAKHDNNNDQTITGNLPSDLTAGTNYRVRVRSTDPVTNEPTSSNFAVLAIPENVNSGSDQTICPSATAYLDANYPEEGSGSWSIISGPDLSLDQFSDISDPESTFTPEGLGDFILRWIVENDCGESFDEVTITVEDTTAPVVDAVSEITVTLDENGAGSLSAAGVQNSDSADACGIASEVLSQTSFGCSDVGTKDITLTVTDTNGNKTEKTISVTVEDTTAPVVDAVSDITVTLDASGAGSLALADVLNSDSTDACGITSEVLSQTSFGCSDVGTKDITLTVTDSNDNETVETISVTVLNDTPELSAITGPDGPQQLTSSVTLSATVTDTNPYSAHFYLSTDGGDTFGDPIEVAIDEVGNISYTFTPENPEVYLVKLVVTDVCGLTDVEEFRYVVIFDPNGGFVTGGGTIWSPAGAYNQDLSLDGQANFGFNAKYKNGKNYTSEVDGSTNFQFKAGNFHFKSSSHEKESLVVSGGFKATYRGYGTVNGKGNYQFLVTVIDADETSNHSNDLFRIKIWDGSGVAYDNNLENTEDNADPSTYITGGSIVIHKPSGSNKKGQQEATVAQTFEPVVEILTSMSVSPNPVSTEALVRFTFNADASAMVEVFDFSNRKVAGLFNGKVSANQVNEVIFNRDGLPAGNYFVRVSASNGQTFVRQILLN